MCPRSTNRKEGDPVDKSAIAEQPPISALALQSLIVVSIRCAAAASRKAMRPPTFECIAWQSEIKQLVSEPLEPWLMMTPPPPSNTPEPAASQ
eukprot:7383850-Prymnesium_polylepis.2